MEGGKGFILTITDALWCPASRWSLREVGLSRSCPQGAPSLRETGKYRTQAAATTAGRGTLRGWGWGREASSCALGTEGWGAGMVLHQSPRHTVRSWVSLGPRPQSARATGGSSRGCLSERLRVSNSRFPQFLGPGSGFLVPPHAARPDGQFSLSQSQSVWAVRLAARNEPAGQPRPAQTRPLQRWSPRHSPGRAVEQREAGAGVRGCRHLASPPPIWRARSTPGNWKTQSGEAASQQPVRMRVRAHTHSRAHRRSGRIWQRWRLVSGFECLYSILERWPSPKGRAFLGQELSEEKGLVWEGSVSLYVLWTHSQALKCCHPILVPGLHRQPFDPSLKRGWRVDLRDCSDLSFCFCFSRPSAYSYPHLDSLPHPNPNLALKASVEI